MLARNAVFKGNTSVEFINAGDTLGLSEAWQPLTTAGAGTITAAMIAAGFLWRTGPVAGYIDTFPDANAIVAALAGNQPDAIVAPGTSWHFLFSNTVAFANTVSIPANIVQGNGTLTIAASLMREYLFTVLNTTSQQLLSCGTTNASPTVTFVLPPGQSSYPLGNVPGGVDITPGASVSGTGITAGTTVAGLIYGMGGITGVTLSANATATNNPIGLTFGASIRMDSLGTRGL